MKRIVPLVVALLAVAAPAQALQEGKLDPRWDKDLSKALAKLKVGMDANQAEHVFASIEPKKLMDTVDYRSKMVQVFHLTPAKQRIYLNANFYQVGKFQSPHKAILVFQAPLDDYRGNAAKLVRWGLVDKFEYDPWARVDPIEVKDQAELKKLELFKI